MLAIYTYAELRVLFLCNVCKCMKFRCYRIKGQKRMCLITTKNLRINTVNPELYTTKKNSHSLFRRVYVCIQTQWNVKNSLQSERCVDDEVDHLIWHLNSFITALNYNITVWCSAYFPSLYVIFLLCLSFRLNSHQHRRKNTRLLFVW